MPAKTGAITIMPLPNSVNELQQFLGMITNLGKFIPNLAEVTSPFCTLLKKGVEFNLQKPQLDAIWKLKLLITTTPCLKTWSTNTFEGGKLWRIRCLSATKAQNPNLPKMVPCWICISITSWLRKTLCPKKNEKETLSIVFVVERFHEYLYTRKFTAINDHQPLKLIFGKFIVNCLPQIQRFFLCLQKYEFDLKYSPGKTMLVLDALSWAYIKNSKPEFDENSLIHYVHFVISNLPTSNKRLEQFKEETQKDPILQIHY